jgi:hypothetical protein
MSEALERAIEELRREAMALADQIRDDPKISALKKKLTALNTLEDLESIPKTSFGDLLDFGIAPPITNPGVAGPSIEPDEFYGKESLEAAKLYLRKRQRPASLEEIIAGIKQGGGNPGSESALRVSLTRSTYQIAKINENLFGLVEFYGGSLKRGRGPAKKKNGNAEGIGEGVAPDETADLETDPQDSPSGEGQL